MEYRTADGRGFSSHRAQANLAAAAAANHAYAEQLRAESAARRAVSAAHQARCGMTVAQVQAHNAATLAQWNN